MINRFRSTKAGWTFETVRCLYHLVPALLVLIFLVSCARIDPITALFSAVQNGDLDEVREAIEFGANINDTQNGLTPLLIAMRHKHREITEYLLEHGADPNIIQADRERAISAIQMAVSQGDIEMVQLLLDAGAKLYIDKRITRDRQYLPLSTPIDGVIANPLTVATEHGDFEMVQFLLDRGADPNLLSWSGYILPVEAAVYNRQVDCMKILIDRGADPLPALKRAVEIQNVDIVKMLLTFEALQDKEKNEFTLPIFLACEKGNVEIVNMLLDVGRRQIRKTAYRIR